MQAKFCPEQLRQVCGQTQGMVGSTAVAIDSLPAFGLSSACKCLGPEVLTALTVPAQLPGFPCTLPMARLLISLLGQLVLTPPMSLQGWSPAPLPGHGVPPSWACPRVLVWPQLIPRKCTMPGAGAALVPCTAPLLTGTECQGWARLFLATPVEPMWSQPLSNRK